MKFDKIYVGRGIAAPTPVRRTTHLGEDTGDTFARILQEERDAAEAELTWLPCCCDGLQAVSAARVSRAVRVCFMGFPCC